MKKTPKKKNLIDIQGFFKKKLISRKKQQIQKKYLKCNCNTTKI